MKRKILLTIPLATLAALAIPTIAQAHNATATGTCQQGVSWNAWNYQKELVNTITVTIDGTVRHSDPDMKASDAGTIATDKTIPHTWAVVVNAPGVTHDKAFNGLYPACVTVPTTTVASSTTVVTTTTASPTTSVPDVATTVVTDPTTTVVAVGEPPVPTTVVLAPPVTIAAGVAEEPVLPRTGLDGTIILVAAILVIGGVFLVLRGRRVG